MNLRHWFVLVYFSFALAVSIIISTKCSEISKFFCGHWVWGNLVSIINIIYGHLLGSFCTVCSLHCSVVCRLDLFHFGVFPWCIHFLVHSVVVKLVVSKNCPKLVHKYLQNYSKLNVTKNWNCVKKLLEIIFVTRNFNHFEVEGTSWKKLI